MPLPIELSLPNNEQKPSYLTLDSFKRGVITLIDESRLPQNALKIADNIFLYEDGQPGPRPGVDWYGNESPNGEPIDGFDYFDSNGDIHLVISAGGVIYRSLDDGITWSECTGGTFTAGIRVNMNQNGDFLYLTNGENPIMRYDGTTTLDTYTALATPATPTIAKTGLAATTHTYHMKVSAVNKVGFSTASAKATITVSLTRDNWDNTSNFITTSVAAVTGAERYDWYISEDDLDYFYVSSSVAPTFKDNGTSIPITSTKAPVDNTTTGPLVEELVNVGSRMYGIRDKNNRYRIWFTGTGVYGGAFSNAYDGGYLDWQEGGKYVPVKVEDYRDGKGLPLATIWCKSADGQGCILQMSLDVLQVEDIAITVPSAYKLPGSRGTPAPNSVVNVLNDYMFYNSQAFYNLGSRAQFLNLLSTDETSGNIRPTMRRIKSGGEEFIASVYFDARVYFSVPYVGSTNTHTIIYDTERKAWLPTAFTMGFKQFLRYTDTGMVPRLLALKPGDNRLSMISRTLGGDYGKPFTSRLVTGLYPIAKNRFEFLWKEEGELELANPRGTISVELWGTERSKGFIPLRSKVINIAFQTEFFGWDVTEYDAVNWDTPDEIPEFVSEPSIKRYFNVQREVNDIQWHITTNEVGAFYILRTLQSWGTETQGGKPRHWRLK